MLVYKWSLERPGHTAWMSLRTQPFRAFDETGVSDAFTSPVRHRYRPLDPTIGRPLQPITVAFRRVPSGLCLPVRLRTSAACMTILDFPSEQPPPADSQVDAEAVGVHSGEDEDEQSAAAALLGMAAALPMYSLSQYSPGSAKRQLLDDRQLLSNSRGGSSDDLSSIYSSDGGSVKRQRAETKDHGGAHASFRAPRR